jgi:hypothetical protein
MGLGDDSVKSLMACPLEPATAQKIYTVQAKEKPNRDASS